MSSVVKNRCIDKFREKLGYQNTPYAQLKKQENPKIRLRKFQICHPGSKKHTDYQRSNDNSYRLLKQYKRHKNKMNYSVDLGPNISKSLLKTLDSSRMNSDYNDWEE
mmetsp:Transcript_4095/g.3427  ORF Transcript_4095/g.3427 Transcript_4095/m.3427 type:complete len:107 (+) Transcript_4095:555-875(+)